MSSNIHINPSFAPKCQVKIYLNPCFVNSCKQNAKSSASVFKVDKKLPVERSSNVCLTYSHFSSSVSNSSHLAKSKNDNLKIKSNLRVPDMVCNEVSHTYPSHEANCSWNEYSNHCIPFHAPERVTNEYQTSVKNTYELNSGTNADNDFRLDLLTNNINVENKALGLSTSREKNTASGNPIIQSSKNNLNSQHYLKNIGTAQPLKATVNEKNLSQNYQSANRTYRPSASIIKISQPSTSVSHSKQEPRVCLQMSSNQLTSKNAYSLQRVNSSSPIQPTFVNKKLELKPSRRSKYTLDKRKSDSKQILTGVDLLQNPTSRRDFKQISSNECHSKRERLIFRNNKNISRMKTLPHKSQFKLIRSRETKSKLATPLKNQSSKVDITSLEQQTENLNVSKETSCLNLASATSSEIENNKYLAKKLSRPLKRKSVDFTPVSSEKGKILSSDYVFCSKLKLVRNANKLMKVSKYNTAKNNNIMNKSNKNVYKTRSKLINKFSPVTDSPRIIFNSKYKKLNQFCDIPNRRRSLSFRRSSLLKGKLSVAQRKWVALSKKSEPFNKLKNKYKLINSSKDSVKHVSRFKLSMVSNLKKPSSAVTSAKHISPFKGVSRNTKKSNKFINIGGNLYKSTRNSLKKQDLTPVKMGKFAKEPLSSLKSKRLVTGPSQSKYVYKRRLSTADMKSGTLIEIVRRKKLAQFKHINDYCFFYNKYGKCKKEKKGCPFIHDSNRIAICTRFLHGSCDLKDCPFSHTLDKNKMPVCSHFNEGMCHRDSCPYRHVRVNPKAPVCRHFLKGYCPQGEECKNKHILICEEFSETGSCPRGKSCLLSHRKSASKVKSSLTSRADTNTSHKETNTRTPNSRIGVLGLKDSAKVSMAENNKNTVSLRYFECPASEDKTGNNSDKLETGNSWNQTRNNSDNLKKPDVTTAETNPPSKSVLDKGSASEVDTWDEKRERLLKKIEKLKRNYKLGSESATADQNPSFVGRRAPVCPPSPTSSPKIFRFPPLPAVLPSFIPLVWPEDEKS